MQITIIGSTKGSGFNEQAEAYAIAIGQEIAQRNHILLYGPEITVESLPYIAAKSARKNDGTTIAVAIGRHKTAFFDQEAATHTIYTDCSGGAGREVVLVNSADAVIAIGGGSGTLTEMSMAYMNHIPVVAMKGSGGWADKLVDEYIDDRKKYPIVGAGNAQEAIDAVERLFQEFGEADNAQYV